MDLCLVEEHGRSLGKASPAADCLRRLFGFDTDYAPRLAGAEDHPASGCRKQSVVGTYAHVGAWTEASTALAHDDLARLYDLTTEGFHTKTLGVGITAVPGTAATFFVSHLYPSCAALSA
jgi:hypothetical protein